MALLRRVTEEALPAGAVSGFESDVLAGLRREPKCLAPKYFYDDAGSLLFEQITRLPEYYPTRCELEILKAHAQEIATLLPRPAALIEFGSGSHRKARLLLDAACGLQAYVPVDISASMLREEALVLQRAYPRLKIIPVAVDFTKPFRLPSAAAALKRVGFFPGSTIGNFEPNDAVEFLRHVGHILGRDAVLIVGVDLIKDPIILTAAYNDTAGVTAQFNLNLLVRINRELGANFDLAAFRHRAFYNAEKGRVEMHLVSLTRQTIRLAGQSFDFGAGETIHTENSYKYSLQSMAALAHTAGFQALASWSDPKAYFSVHALATGR